MKITLPAVRVENTVYETAAGRIVVPGYNIPEKTVEADPAFLKKLVLEAREAAKNANARFSNSHVGCAIVMEDDPEQKIHIGGNFEGSCLNDGMCGERVGLYHVSALGFRRLKYLAMSCSDLLNESFNNRSPCGQCRHIISEFVPASAADDKTLIIVDNGDDGVLGEITDLQRLLPHRYHLPEAL